MALTIDNFDGIFLAGVTGIIDPDDLRNGRLNLDGSKVAADDTFYDIIEWIKDEIPQIEHHSFFTGLDVGYIGETMVVFSGTDFRGNSQNVFIDAAVLRHAAPGTPEAPRETYEGSATARAYLEVAFQSKVSARKLYPGFKARHPEADNVHPVGRVRPDWGSGPMYEFAEGADVSKYPETDPVTNTPTYSFVIDGEWLVFERVKKGVRLSGFTGTVVPAWRLRGR